MAKSIVRKILSPFQRFLKIEASGGIILMAATVIALVWANSPFAGFYFDLWLQPLEFRIANIQISSTIGKFINDALMSIFFFHVGLEIKREIMEGELSTIKKASLPLMAALGGMVIPAGLFVLLNDNPDASAGWGIPMATDIAFSLGVLGLLGRGVPLALKVFLTAFAIADDIGAVLIIAVFYTKEFHIEPLYFAAAIILLLLIINRMGYKNPWIYIFPGIVAWFAVHHSGLHATIAGVAIALCIPSSSEKGIRAFVMEVSRELRLLPTRKKPGKGSVRSKKELEIFSSITSKANEVQSPVQHLEHQLHSFVAYVIMPLFALANAGISLADPSLLISSLSLAIAISLFAGKLVGVFAFAKMAVLFKMSELPKRIDWKQMGGAGMLGGIGFTMSLFIANLAFEGQDLLLDEAKAGILLGSLVAGVAGYLFLRLTGKK